MIKIRVFYAIEFDDNIKEYIFDKQQIIKKLSTRGNFTKKENIHLTLQFIGEVKSTEVGKLSKALKNTVEGIKGFSIDLKNIGSFPRKDGNIVWIGVQKSEELQNIYNNLCKNLLKLDYKTDSRPYKPHITIGRKVEFDKDFKDIKREMDVHKSIDIRKISLMESKNINGILRYIPKCSVEMGK